MSYSSGVLNSESEVKLGNDQYLIVTGAFSSTLVSAFEPQANAVNANVAEATNVLKIFLFIKTSKKIFLFLIFINKIY